MTSLFLLGLTACAYDAPVDPAAPTPGSSITGEVLATGIEVPADVIVLAYDATNPPPPEGTGAPVSFATIPAAAFTGPGAGISSASYTLTNLPPGTYLLRGLMDLDGDFNPFDPVAAGATCGDLAGAHLTDLGTQEVATVDLPEATAINDVSIVIGSLVPIERPAFTVVPDAGTISRAGSLDPTTPQRFSLSATAVHTALAPDFPLDLSGPCVPVPDQPFCDPSQLDLCDTALWVHVRDADGDGLPDLRPDLPPEAGIPDIFPRIYLQALDGPEGESWSAEAIPLLAEIGAMQLGAPQPVPFGTPVPMASLSVTWLPIALRTHPDGQSTNPATGEAFDQVDLRVTGNPNSLPAGRWSITVVSESGQTWQLPNNLAAIGVSTQPDGFDPALQGASLLVE